MSMWWVCPDFVWEGIITAWKEKLRDHGPMVSGFLFGLGWWLWVDAVVIEHVHRIAQHIPGSLATFATIIMNLVNRETASDYDPFDDADSRRARFWLLISYLLSFGAFLGSIIILISEYALKDVHLWPGVACVLQVWLVLSSGLVFFLSKNTSSGSYLQQFIERLGHVERLLQRLPHWRTQRPLHQANEFSNPTSTVATTAFEPSPRPLSITRDNGSSRDSVVRPSQSLGAKDLQQLTTRSNKFVTTQLTKDA